MISPGVTGAALLERVVERAPMSGHDGRSGSG